MYLLYLDESGSIGNQDESYFVLGGVCIPERSIKWLTDQIDNLASEIEPENPSTIEFHASEVFGGRNAPWNNYRRREERIEVIKKVLCLLANAGNDTVVFASAIHKDSFRGSNLMRMAFEDLCTRFDMYLNRIYHQTNVSHKGMIIFDKSSYRSELEELALEFRQQGTQWMDLRNIREVPFFVDSKASRLIQLADHIAYAVFRRYNANDITYFNCIENRFDENEGIIHGLSHKQTYNPTCTCPSCITRQ
jgi:hypothetical protein